MVMNVEGRKKILGSVIVPGDKSISHRAVMLASIASGMSTISGISRAQDVRSTIDAIRTLEVPVHDKDGKVMIEGRGLNGFEKQRRSAPLPIDCGNSGTTARLLMGLLSGAGVSARLTGDQSLSMRPMDRVVAPLREIGAKISAESGHLPVEIQPGRLVPFEYKVPVASAQVKSAFILAALFIQGRSVITEFSDTRDHTERMLVLMNGDIRKRSFVHEKQIIVSGRRELTPLDITIPGDVSSAVFFIALALTLPGSEIIVKNVLLNHTRAHVLELFERMGGNIEVKVDDELPEPMGSVRVRSSRLNGTTVSGVEIPLVIDEIPAIAAVACFAKGETLIRGASELRMKESDRIRSIVDMVRAFGGAIIEREDGFLITGGKKLSAARVPTSGDHRIAMAASVIAANVMGSSQIEDAECVNVSYPGYFDALEEHCSP
jgi:3-phosphoshikimate 1-carboxyvinyltransferase